MALSPETPGCKNVARRAPAFPLFEVHVLPKHVSQLLRCWLTSNSEPVLSRTPPVAGTKIEVHGVARPQAAGGHGRTPVARCTTRRLPDFQTPSPPRAVSEIFPAPSLARAWRGLPSPVARAGRLFVGVEVAVCLTERRVYALLRGLDRHQMTTDGPLWLTDALGYDCRVCCYRQSENHRHVKFVPADHD